MTKDEILARKTGCGGNAGLMESEENIEPFPSLPTVLGNHQRTVITTFPPHGDYYWIWTLLLCSRQDISALQQQDARLRKQLICNRLPTQAARALFWSSDQSALRVLPDTVHLPP